MKSMISLSIKPEQNIYSYIHASWKKTTVELEEEISHQALLQLPYSFFERAHILKVTHLAKQRTQNCANNERKHIYDKL